MISEVKPVEEMDKATKKLVRLAAVQAVRKHDSREQAAAQLGMRRAEVRRVRPFEDALERHLHVFVKIGTTPSRFPRRPGVARKRPLGA